MACDSAWNRLVAKKLSTISIDLSPPRDPADRTRLANQMTISPRMTCRALSHAFGRTELGQTVVAEGRFVDFANNSPLHVQSVDGYHRRRLPITISWALTNFATSTLGGTCRPNVVLGEDEIQVASVRSADHDLDGLCTCATSRSILNRFNWNVTVTRPARSDNRYFRPLILWPISPCCHTMLACAYTKRMPLSTRLLSTWKLCSLAGTRISDQPAWSHQ